MILHKFLRNLITNNQIVKNTLMILLRLIFYNNPVSI